MSNLKEKFDKRFSKVQDGIDKGREKVELVKEKSYLGKEIAEYGFKKASLLLEMGELLYTKLRKNEILDSEFDDYKTKITEIDKYIYDISMNIKELEKSRIDELCECGSIVNPTAKFCGECGKRVEIDEVEIEKKVCSNCESEVSIDSKYCVCCGFKLDEKIEFILDNE